jgi:hypothetical protein
MAKALTDELKYYSRDTKAQDNEQYIEAKHGPVGFYIIEKLRMHIYGGVHGYYCEFKEMHQYLFCKNNCAIDIKDLKAVLETCFLPEVNLFNKDLFERYNILTSSGIQKRWVKIVTDARRKNAVVNKDYCLIIQEETPINSVITPELQLNDESIPPASLTHNAGVMQEELRSDVVITSSVIPQIKVNNIKEDNSRSEERKLENQVGKGANSLPAPVQPVGETGKNQSEGSGGKARRAKLQPPSEAEALDYFKSATTGTMHPAAAEMEARKFAAHYQANGWVQNGNKPIVDWKAAANGWLLRNLGGEYAIKGGVVVKSPAGVSPPANDQDTAKEVEYLYQRYLEDQLKPELLSVKHYDFMKKSGLVNLSTEQTNELTRQAVNIRIKQIEGSNEASLIRLMTAYMENKPHDQDPIKADTPRLYSILKPMALRLIFQNAKDGSQPAIVKSFSPKK